MWGAGCCGPPRAPTTGPPSRGRASCLCSPLGTALTSAVCTLPCPGPCYSQSSGSSCPLGQVQTHNIRGGPGDLASGLSVEGPVGRGGREPPQHPSVIGQCLVPLGPCLWTVLSRRARNKGRQLHRQGRQRKRLICEKQMGPAVHCSVVFLLLFFQYVKVGPLPLAFSLMLRLELCGKLGRGKRREDPRSGGLGREPKEGCSQALRQCIKEVWMRWGWGGVQVVRFRARKRVLVSDHPRSCRWVPRGLCWALVRPYFRCQTTLCYLGLPWLGRV